MMLNNTCILLQESCGVKLMVMMKSDPDPEVLPYRNEHGLQEHVVAEMDNLLS